MDTIPPLGITDSEFREAAKNLIDIIIDYNNSLKSERKPLFDVQPGFMRNRVALQASEHREDWRNVFEDIESVIFNGHLHSLSSGYLGFFPSGFSYPALLGDVLCSATASYGSAWHGSPPSTELETIMMDWLANALDLPKCFIHDGKGPGGGVIQGSASESILVTLLSAREKTIKEEQSRDANQSSHEITSRMVAYTQRECHMSVKKAAMIAMVTLRLLDVDENISLRGEILKKAIEEDRKKGKIPVYLCATTGTTACCTYDNLVELGPICRDEDIWLHVDAAFAGSALLCPEYRYVAEGLETATSFSFNPHKWMMVNLDCNALWLRDSSQVTNALSITSSYCSQEARYNAINYRHWQIPLGRRFRSIKLWFVMRMIGIEGLRHHVRGGVARAKHFEKLLRSDKRFEVLYPVTLGMVCFRMADLNCDLKKTNSLNQRLNQRLFDDSRFYLTTAEVDGVYFFRASTGSNNCSIETIEECWKHIQEKSEMVSEEDKKSTIEFA